MSPHKLLQDKVTAFGKAVRHGDEATALQLLGDVAREAEARGIARCAEAARNFHEYAAGPTAAPGQAAGGAAKLATLFDRWAGTTRQAPAPEPAPEQAHEAAAPEPEQAAAPEREPGGEAVPGPEPGEEGEAEEGHPKRRRKGRSHE